MPSASERKSWSLTRTGSRSHLAPTFLKLPICSFFFVSTLNDGQALVDKSFPLLPDVKELLIAIGVLGGGDLFAVHAEFELQLFQQAAHGVLAHGDSQSGEFFGNLACRSPAPLHPRDGVSGSVVTHQFFNSGDDFGRFFSSGLRPPPALRMRSISRSCSSSSRRPLATV